MRERKLGQGLPGSFPPKAMQATDAPLATLRRLRCCGRPVGGLCYCDVRSADAPHAVVPSSRGQPNIGIRSVQNHLIEAEVKSKPGGRHNQTGMTGRQGCPPLHAGVTAGDRPHAAGCKHLGRSFSSSEPPTCREIDGQSQGRHTLWFLPFDIGTPCHARSVDKPRFAAAQGRNGHPSYVDEPVPCPLVSPAVARHKPSRPFLPQNVQRIW